MNKLLTALLFGAMGLSASVMGADQDSQSSQQSQSSPGKSDSAQSDATRTGTPKDCSKMTGKEKDKCTQATPAGPVEMQSGEQKKGKSDIAKQRDREKQGNQAGKDAPAQSNAAVGGPEERSPTGQAQTGANAEKNNSSAKNEPQQTKDTVGHPQERGSTGEAQTGKEPGEGVARKSQ
jgi:hypothetical protein